MGEAEDQAIARAFAAVPERNTGDVLLRTTQQHHVQLSVMADTKANILITVSSIILTLILGKMSDPNLRAAAPGNNVGARRPVCAIAPFGMARALDVPLRLRSSGSGERGRTISPRHHHLGALPRRAPDW